MPLLRLDTASLHYGTLALLDGVELNIARGDKLGLLGRNGAGKTTLLRVIAGEQQLDGGERWLRPSTRVSWLKQALPEADQQTVFDVIASGLAEVGALLAEFHHLTQAGQVPDMDQLARVQQQIEAVDGWQLQQRVDATISQLSLDGNALMASLSGGWRRRVALGQALVGEPDILLLDEPTNHLDIPAIQWLEEQLAAFNGALVLITHDRRFLQNTANVMAELDRGTLTTWRGDYAGFLRHREQQLVAEERANALFDKKLAQEEVWIRQGIKARRTRNEGRVRALEAMRNQRSDRRERQGSASFGVEDASRSGKIVAELEHVSLAFGDQTVIRDFSTIIQRGDRIGIVGANGAGKSTLVKLMLGQLQPDSGSIKLGSKLEIAYSDQLRGHLDPKLNLIDNVCGGQEFIELNGQRRHAISYLGDFLFGPERTRVPVSALSGGEQNRAVLAKLFTKPANLLVLDEPTNDLDMETLELLEEILLDFDGTVLLVSHDRAFMDNVVTGIIALDGDGGVSEEVGAYSDWERRGGQLSKSTAAKPVKTLSDKAAGKSTDKSTRKRDREEQARQRATEQLLAEIDQLEQQQVTLETALAEPGLFQDEPDTAQRLTAELDTATTALADAYQRWEALEAGNNGAAEA